MVNSSHRTKRLASRSRKCRIPASLGRNRGTQGARWICVSRKIKHLYPCDPLKTQMKRVRTRRPSLRLHKKDRRSGACFPSPVTAYAICLAVHLPCFVHARRESPHRGSVPWRAQSRALELAPLHSLGTGLGSGRIAATVLRIPTAAARLCMSRRCRVDRIGADGTADHSQQSNGKQETLGDAFHGFSRGQQTYSPEVWFAY